MPTAVSEKLKNSEYLFTQIVSENQMRQACGWLRAAGIEGASYCKAVEDRSGWVVRVPIAAASRLESVEGGPPEAGTFMPIVYGAALRMSPVEAFRKRSAWYAIEEYKENVVWAVSRIMRAAENGGGNGDQSYLESVSFRSKESALNWVREVRCPEMADWYDSKDFAIDEASDHPEREHSVYLTIKDKNGKPRVNVIFEIARTEVLDNA